MCPVPYVLSGYQRETGIDHTCQNHDPDRIHFEFLKKYNAAGKDGCEQPVCFGQQDRR